MPGIWPNPPQKLHLPASLWRQAALGLVLAAVLPSRAAEITVTPAGAGLLKSSTTVNGPTAGSGPALLTLSVQDPLPPAVGEPGA